MAFELKISMDKTKSKLHTIIFNNKNQKEIMYEVLNEIAHGCEFNVYDAAFYCAALNIMESMLMSYMSGENRRLYEYLRSIGGTMLSNVPPMEMTDDEKK